ncbi:MAG: pyridinium-3,5-bisthiocarboxylic acid mononucleotide nickel chelatase [Pseudonocardiales bacterium]|nr:pyridinium-3,5-bisthiocarboxylic acid mononucleotide nickel chelatase [Pseudonocardiales bacterium]
MILWLNPVSGISGDMLLGALLGLGAPLDAVRDAVSGTGINGWAIERSEVLRGGLAATRVLVSTDEDGVTERRATELMEIVARARPASVAELALAAVTALAETEAALHGVPLDLVHLHELGGIDTVVDTVGVAAALHALDVTAVHCGPLALGAGTVRTRHGVLPVPAPATAALIARMHAPVVPAGVDGETVTPTGVALLLAAGARFGPLPAMTVDAVGYGAGAREVAARPNVLQALLGGARAPDRDMPDGEAEDLMQIETNVDDVTGELLGHLIGRLLTEGAVDAWVSPIVMKKGRPAHTVHLLAAPEHAAHCERVLLRETGSLGARRGPVRRTALPRRSRTVEVDGQLIRLKYGPWGGKPEHDDVAAAAESLGLPLREVADRARALGTETADACPAGGRPDDGLRGDDLDRR